MKEKLLYSAQYDCLMVAKPIYHNSHWYNFEGDPWGYEGKTAHKMDFLLGVAGFELIDTWKEPTEYRIYDNLNCMLIKDLGHLRIDSSLLKPGQHLQERSLREGSVWWTVAECWYI